MFKVPQNCRYTTNFIKIDGNISIFHWIICFKFQSNNKVAIKFESNSRVLLQRDFEDIFKTFSRHFQGSFFIGMKKFTIIRVMFTFLL